MNLPKEDIDLRLGSRSKSTRAKMIDVVAVSHRRGDPPCRSVRLYDKTLRLKRSQIMTHRCRRHAEMRLFDHSSRADRLSGANVLLNNCPEDL